MSLHLTSFQQTACKHNTASEAWKFKHAKRKTDKDDALRLAQLEALGQLPTVTMPPQRTRQWRALIAGRQTLMGRRIAVQNQIRAYFSAQGLPMPRGSRAWSQLGLQGIEQYARPLAECAAEELWRGLLALAITEYRQLLKLLEQTEAKLDALGKQNEAVQLLESIPGVGARTAETVTAYLDDPHRFQNAKQVSAWCRSSNSRVQFPRRTESARGEDLKSLTATGCVYRLGATQQ